MGDYDVALLKKELESMKDEQAKQQAQQNERLKSIETKLDLLIEGRIKPDPRYSSDNKDNKKFVIELVKAVSAGIAGAIATVATLWGKFNS